MAAHDDSRSAPLNQQGEDGGEERRAREEDAPQSDSADGSSAQRFPGVTGPSGSTVQENEVELSKPATSEDMEDLESGPEEEEEEEEEEDLFLVELAKLAQIPGQQLLAGKQQDACKKVLQEQKEVLDLVLKEQLELLKANENHLEEISCQMYRNQEHLARQRKKLMDHHEAKVQAQSKHQQSQKQLEETSSQYEHTTKEHHLAESSVSHLQGTLDKLTQNLVSTQELSKDLSSKVKTLQTMSRQEASRRTQAEEQKLKQDGYVDHLTVELERLREQKSLMEAHIRVQSDETQAFKESLLSEVDMNLEVLVVMQKQLTQQWSSSLLALRKEDEACSSMQEAVHNVGHQQALAQREIEGYKKSIAEEEEKNEMLTLKLKWFQMDCTTSKMMITEKENQREGLHTLYMTLLCTLTEIELETGTLKEETRSLQAELTNQRRQKEKNSLVHLELDDKIMTHLQQKLSHNNAAKYSRRLTGKMVALRKEKRRQLCQKENEVSAMRLLIQQVERQVSGLTFTQETLEEQISKQIQALVLSENQISSLNICIGQKQSSITTLNKRIRHIVANTGQEDLSPMHIKIHGIMAQSEELAASIKTSKQQWMKQQDLLVGLSQKLEVTRRELSRLQTQTTALQQRDIRLDSRTDSQQRDADAIQRSEKVLHRDRMKLCSLLSRNKQLNQALQQENALMETDFIQRLKEAERQAIKLQVKHEKIQEDKDLLLNSLLEAEQQVMLWEKKTQLMKETKAALDSENGKEEREKMTTDIHRKEVLLSRLLKLQVKLLKRGDVTIYKWGTYMKRDILSIRGPRKKRLPKENLVLTLQGLQRQIKDTYEAVSDCDQVMKELQQSQEDLNQKIQQHKQQKTQLYETNDTLTFDLVNLQHNKDLNLAHLVVLQGRLKRLQSVCAGTYKASSTSESVAAAMQKLTERLSSLSSILQRVCADEFPQHQGALRWLSRAIAAQTQKHSGGSQ